MARMKEVLQLSIEYDNLYAPPSKWDWPALLDLLPDEAEALEVTVIEPASPIPTAASPTK